MIRLPFLPLCLCILFFASRWGQAETALALPKTLLFVDDHDILYRAGTRKEPVPLKKYPDNPVLAPENPWEAMIGWISDYRDPKTGKFQMWYQAYNGTPPGNDKSYKCVVAYAESADGKHWTKPDLGLFPYGDIKDTNIVLIGAPDAYGDRYCNSVVVTPDDPDPQKRYKMVYYDWPSGKTADSGGLCLAFSPDGIHWTKAESATPRPASFGAKGRPIPFQGEDVVYSVTKKDGTVNKSWLYPMSMSDAQDVFFDDLKGCYVTYGKMWMQGPDGTSHWKHGMGRMESKDFLHWSKPQFILGQNDKDPLEIEFHTTPVFLYNGQYLALNQILTRKTGTMDIELMSSRDGFQFERNYQGLGFLPRGEGAVFDAATLLTNSTPVPMGDEVYFYYGGYRGTAIGGGGLDQQKFGSKDYHSGVGLAVAQRDRFVAIAPDPEVSLRNSLKVNRETVGKEVAPKPKPNTIGQVTLRPLDLRGVKEITVNADAAKGKVCVELLDEDGYRVRGFSKDDATPLAADSLDQKAVWKDKTLSDLKPGKYMIRVHLDNARLFACTLR